MTTASNQADDDALLAEAEEFIDYQPPTPERAPRGLSDAVDAKGRQRATTFLVAWTSMREQLYIENHLPRKRLPKFVEKYLRLLWDTSEWAALRALATGDVPFFIAWLFRIDQIDVAMINAGYGLADRALLIRYRAALDGYREVAEKRLRALGGVWPPSAT